MREWRFTATVIEWRGPAPFYYAPLPAGVAADIAAVKKQASYGWGVIPVNATIAVVPAAPRRGWDGAESTLGKAVAIDAPGRRRNGAGTTTGEEFTTSLFPRDGTYFLPLKDSVRRPLGVTVGDEIAVTMSIGGRIREPDL